MIPYATIGYEQYMQSMARYSSAAVPIYLVLGHLLCRLPAPVVVSLVGISTFFMGFYAAMFGTGTLWFSGLMRISSEE